MRTWLPVALALAIGCTGMAFATDDGFEHYPGTGGAVTREYGDGSLTTLFASNNGFAGNSFDILANTALTVVGFDCNLDAGTWNIEVWTRTGTCNGFEQNTTGWTLLGTDVVMGAGVDLPTHVDVGGLVMAAGQLNGMIIRCQEYSAFNYTNGGPTPYSNADMTVTTYRGLADGWPPSNVFTYRAWNGTVHYDYGTTPTEDSTWGSIKALFQ